MGVKLDWEEFNWEDEPEEQRQHGNKPRLVRFLAVFAFGIAVIIGGLTLRQYQASHISQELSKVVQLVLDREQAALLNDDVELYLNLQADDPAWRSVQLLPINQNIVRRGPKVIEAGQQDGTIWALTEWEEAGSSFQRIAFFKTINSQLIHAPTSTAYWGDERVRPYAWGDLYISRADEAFADDIAEFVTAYTTATCGDSCPRVTLRIYDRLTVPYSKNVVHIPSPQLVGLTIDGAPVTAFWQRLEMALEAQLLPAHIVFGVQGLEMRARYTALAREFEARNPLITVEVVLLESMSGDLTVDLLELDGALVEPTTDLIYSGAIQDLTQLMQGDASFDQVDFYAQMWQSAWWDDRMWNVPQFATMNVIMYDTLAYRAADNRPPPPQRWTWEEMEAEWAYFNENRSTESLQWSVMDSRLDLLFSRAYSAAGQCNVDCPPLSPAAINEALRWYAAGIEAGYIANIGANDPQFFHFNALTTNRKVATWVESPVNFEYHFLVNPVGVLEFPSSTDFQTTTPLWVTGGVISSGSDRPVAVWEWLKFLTYENPSQGRRLIPVRPSVANQTGFWNTLPDSLQSLMRSAFPTARGVTLSDRAQLNWPAVTSALGD